MFKDMFYFSDVQYRHILKNMKDFEEKDPVLVSCQQMLETLFKGLLQEKFGEIKKTHNLRNLAFELGMEFSLADKNMLGELTSIYFNNRYSSDDYVDYSLEEFNIIVNFSLNLRNELIKFKKPNIMTSSNKFGDEHKC